MADKSEQTRYEQIINAESGASVYATLIGDIHIANGHPLYRFEPFEADTGELDRETALKQPSLLLGAERSVVRFVGREDELADLRIWRDSKTTGISVLVIHGQGGEGKTRLVTKFATESAGQDWAVWRAHHVSDPTPRSVVVVGDPGPSLLVTVDYADRWPVLDLQLLLQNPVLRRPLKTRVLLVSRALDGWWPALRNRLRKAGVSLATPIVLQALSRSVSSTQGLLSSAALQFANALGVHSQPDWQLLGSTGLNDSSTILEIHVVALVAAHTAAIGRSVPATASESSAYLIDREHDYWQTLYNSSQIVTEPVSMAHVVYAASLTGPQSFDVGSEVLHSAGMERSSDRESAINDHARCYPPRREGDVLEPLYPDRLGEDFIALMTVGHSDPNYGADAWTLEALDRLLRSKSSDLGRPLGRTVACITVLAEVAARWEHVAHALDPILREVPELAVFAGPSVVSKLGSINALRLETLDAIDAALPKRPHIDFDDCAADIATRIVTESVIVHQDPARIAEAYIYLGYRLFNAGRYDAALEAGARAVEKSRALAATGDPAMTIKLAEVLGNLAGIHGMLGHASDAVVAGNEAVSVLRGLPETREVNGNRLELARVLDQQGTLLAINRQFHEALVALDEAQLIYRDLIEIVGETELLDREFATALVNISHVLENLGRDDDALEAAEEAAVIRELLCMINGPEYEPGFAMALVLHSQLLLDAGRDPSGLFAVGEASQAVGIFRHLISHSPDMSPHRPHLFLALRNLERVLVKSGKSREALSVRAEADFVRSQIGKDYSFDEELTAIRGFAVVPRHR